MDTEQLIQEFLECERFAVVGASNNTSKIGAQVFAAYLREGFEVYPVNPSREEIQGHKAYPRLQDLPHPTAAVSVITPPPVTRQVVEDAGDAGVSMLWLQPGSESDEVIQRAEELGIRLISGGPCVLVSLRLGHFEA